MFVFLYTLLLLTPSFMFIDGRFVRSADQLMPLFFSSVIADDGNQLPSTQINSQTRLLFVIEHIIKYVSTIKSSERFIDRIIDRQREFSDQIKILQFLNNCFRLTDTFIRREMIQPRFFASLFTFDELERAHQQINELLRVIDIRLNTVKTWIPPTIPFLNV